MEVYYLPSGNVYIIINEYLLYNYELIDQKSNNEYTLFYNCKMSLDNNLLITPIAA